MSGIIDRLWPSPAEDLDDEALLAEYAFPEGQPWLRMNFITSIDGAATRAGRSGGLGDNADRRVFDLLRRPAHAILLGAGTARIEGYGAMSLDAESADWRVAHGLAPHPVFALVTQRLDLHPDSPIFADAPVRPIIYTVERASEAQRRALEAVADVVVLDAQRTGGAGGGVSIRAVREDLTRRGHTRVHSEGGPHLFGAALAEDTVDELCLTVAPTLESGTAGRIAAALIPGPTPMRLGGVLRSGDELLLRYLRV